jgi:hypothetical protein
MPDKVFVSYSRNDIMAVKAICDFLETVELVFRDEDSLIAGEPFADELKRQIKRSNVIVVFWSVSSSTSIWVGREIQDAIRLKRPILPVLLDKTPLSTQLAPLNAIDLSTWNGSSETDQVQKLVRDTKLKSSYVPSSWWPTLLPALGLAVLILVFAAITLYENQQTQLTAVPVASPSQSSTPSTSSTIPLPLGDASSAELGVDYLLGLGTEIDVQKGLQLLDKALLPSGDLRFTHSLLEEKMKEFNRSDFTEIIKSIDLLASGNLAAATFVEGVFAANGFTHPPCAANCFDLASQQASKLKIMGRSDLSDFVERTITEKLITTEKLDATINFGESKSLRENKLLGDNESIFINTRKLPRILGSTPLNRGFSSEGKPRVVVVP